MVETRWVGAANIIDPFWNRLPKFFVYPLHLQPLLLMISMSIVGLLVLPLPVIGRVVRLILWGILFKYSFSALKATAQGDLVPPKINTHTISKDFHQVFKQLGIYFAIYFIFAKLTTIFGIYPGLSFLVLALLFVPAMIILLVTTDSLLQALNPMLFIRLAMRIGWGYLLMYFFLFLLGLAPAVVGSYLFSTLPLSVSLFLVGVAKSYYTIISYHLMGYVILQYHESIGYEVDYENFHDPELEKGRMQEESPEFELLRQVNVLVKEGRLDEAIAMIEQRTGISGFQDLTVSERYLNLLKIRKRSAEMLQHLPVHLDLLAKNDARQRCCELYLQWASLKPESSPAPDTLLKIGAWLIETGDTKASIEAFNRLIKTYPQSHLVPRAYFRSAQIVNDHLLKPDKARRILKALISRYPDHDIVPQAKSYLDRLPAAG
jgi:tetratricopeptide (TPR) repeat protein